MVEGNGIDTAALPASRQAAVEQASLYYQEIAHARDQLTEEVAKLKASLEAYKVRENSQTSLLAEMESRLKTMELTRDQAVADRCKYEALFVTMQAQMRAFRVPAEPLIQDADYQQ